MVLRRSQKPPVPPRQESHTLAKALPVHARPPETAPNQLLLPHLPASSGFIDSVATMARIILLHFKYLVLMNSWAMGLLGVMKLLLKHGGGGQIKPACGY